MLNKYLAFCRRRDSCTYISMCFALQLYIIYCQRGLKNIVVINSIYCIYYTYIVDTTINIRGVHCFSTGCCVFAEPDRIIYVDKTSLPSRRRRSAAHLDIIRTVTVVTGLMNCARGRSRKGFDCVYYFVRLSPVIRTPVRLCVCIYFYILYLFVVSESKSRTCV